MTAPVVGIEFGSTRIKAVAIGMDGKPLASGAHEWENVFKDGVWTYSLADAEAGLRDTFARLKEDYAARTGEPLRRLDALGISGMMHGYLPFDREGRPLCEFRTWRNTITQEAAERLTEAFRFNIPQRWSIAHLYQEILNGDERVRDIAFLTTLAGYFHWKLTGRKVAGVGEASGMFPIDSAGRGYHPGMMETFDRLTADRKYPWRLRDILPEIQPAGGDGGCLTEAGARLLDPSGELEAGCPVAPPEGDAETGMVATRSVAPRTANVSAGTSIFAMVVLDAPLRGLYPEIDVVATPTGKPAAMSHANTCTGDLNAWVELLGGDYGALFRESLKGDPDCGGIVSVPYISGESITGFAEGRPLLLRTADAKFTLANFMRAHLYSAFVTMKLGLDKLKPEGCKLESVTGHGGIFKSRGIAQQYLADALEADVTCMETAGEGGPWGMALLAAYTRRAKEGLTLDAFLDEVFRSEEKSTLRPTPEGVAGFKTYTERFVKALDAERAALALK
ncbi:MAG: ATPase [Kiritimatiellae bacterium]|nr:ATPase [Kiritimatiellia bacterium]